MVPIGGMVGVSIGLIEGVCIGQILGEHMGLISRVLVHSACTWPFIQTH